MDVADRCSVNSLRDMPGSNPVQGRVRWDPLHSLWNGVMLGGALLAPFYAS
jgi:stearoyl-CoA desaturase (delta-9 desaturase)